MEKTLVILEISRKQDYIFGSRGMSLRENRQRSWEIGMVTGSDFFRATWEPYREAEHLVFSGGGHTVLQFPDAGEATAFIRAVTRRVLTEFRGMELFAKQLPYDAARTPGENLTRLTAALEQKKTLRRSAFRRVGFGMEETDSRYAFLPALQEKEGQHRWIPEVVPAPAGTRYIRDFEEMGQRMIAVIHIDGNAMGTRIRRIYEEQKDWVACCRSIRDFSHQIQSDFEAAFLETVERVAEYQKKRDGKGGSIPIRPIILAGDDVCFVTDGSIGLECARVFLESLSQRELLGRPYAACAGVSIVLKGANFRAAYQRAEALCANAKRFSSRIDPAGGISAMDWQFEPGEIRGSLSEIRRDYEAEDGSRLTLRPVAMVVPEEQADAAKALTGGLRTYGFFRSLCRGIQRERAGRAGLFQLMGAVRQGIVETKFTMIRDRQKRIAGLLPGGQVFAELEGKPHSLLFDALESREWFVSFDEVAE